MTYQEALNNYRMLFREWQKAIQIVREAQDDEKALTRNAYWTQRRSKS